MTASLDLAVAAVLVCGHVLADFLFQNQWMIREKNRLVPLLTHSGVVAVIHGATLWPLVGSPVIPVAVGLAVFHGATDRAKVAFEGWAHARDRKLRTFAFLADQFLHGVVLVAAWFVLRGATGVPPAWVVPVAGVVAVFVFNGHGAGAFVRFLLADLRRLPAGGDDGEAETVPAHGLAIGMLERWMVLLLVLASQWSAIGLVLAAKSLARFEELKDRKFAETYLVGTLASVLVAMASGAILMHLLK